jgi:uncharacterized protein (TIGR02466 family)
MNFQLWFPTVIGVDFVTEEVKTSVKNKITQWIDSGKHNDYLESCREDNLTTSYFKYHDTFADLGLEELREALTDLSLEYLTQIGYSVERHRLRLDSWINFFYPNQSEQQHNHYGNLVSGVYYVTAPERSGDYRFFDPAPIKTMWKTQFLKPTRETIINQNSGSYSPEEGKTILFPSYLEHAVMANKSNDIRISIAYNVNII